MIPRNPPALITHTVKLPAMEALQVAREVKDFIYAEGFGGRGRLQDFETKIVTKRQWREEILYHDHAARCTPKKMAGETG